MEIRNTCRNSKPFCLLLFLMLFMSGMRLVQRPMKIAPSNLDAPGILTQEAEVRIEATQGVIHVPGDYATIADALSVASPGDTVQVAAGMYQEGDLYIPQGVSLVGAGWQITTIDGGGAVDKVLSLQDGSMVEGVTIRGSGPDYFDCGIWVSQGQVTVRNTHITGNAAGVWAWCFDGATCAIDVTLEGNLITANNRSGISGNEHPVITLRNNTIVDNGAHGVSLNHTHSLAENNIIVGNAGSGLVNSVGATVRYNDVWGNGQDYVGGDAGLSLDPLFRDMDAGDYRLHAGSPTVGHGTSLGVDMGALPFTPVGTTPAGLRVTQRSTFTWLLAWEGTGAVGYNIYLGTTFGLYNRRFDVGAATSYTLNHLPGGLTYYATVAAYDEGGDESEVATPIDFEVPATSKGSYEEDSPAVMLTGTWTPVANDSASGKRYALSMAAGDTVQFTFSGDSVTLYRMVSTHGGQAIVTIDGTSYGTLDFYFNEQRWQVPAIYNGLGAGVHTFTLRVVTSAHADATGHNVAVDAFAVPSPYSPTPEQQRALARVNWHRQIAGIPPVRASYALNMAAQAHATYDVIHRDTHEEVHSKPGFVGAWPSDRARYFGYDGGVGEDMHFIGDPVAAVDGWMETVYHRNLMMGYGFEDMGYGTAQNGRHHTDVLDMSSRTWSGPSPATRLIYTYPADGQNDVPHLWVGKELPDPLPDKPKPVGYPVSLYIAQPATTVERVLSTRSLWHAPRAIQSSDWAVTIAELRDVQGQLVPIYGVHQETDPNGMGMDVVFLIAQDPLALDMLYTARVAGSDSRGQAFDHTWSFTTYVTASVQSVRVAAGACGADLWWDTAGEATTYIEYGTTSAYGTQLTGETVATMSHGVTLMGLTAETPYHYRIVSQDMRGNTRTTEDRTFITRAPYTHSVPGAYDTIVAALAEASYCDIVDVAAGTYRESDLTVPQGVRLQGAGWTQTVLMGDGSGHILSLRRGSIVEGFTIQGSGTDYFHAGVWVSEGSVTLRNNHIHDNNTGVWAWCFDEATCDLKVTLESNLITGNMRDGLNSNEFAVLIVRNNTLVGNGGYGITLNHNAALAENNIVVNNGATGIANNAGATVQYNAAWNNGQNYSGVQGEANLVLNPSFRDLDGGDYRLCVGSPVIGQGTPDGVDMGALPFNPVREMLRNLSVQRVRVR